MKTHHPILSEIEKYLAATGMGETYFGKKAANNSELVARLRAGGSVHFKTEESIRDFIAENSPSSEPQTTDSLPAKKVGDAASDIQGDAA